MNVSMMLLTYILLFLSLCASVFSFPSTPLNERSQEISWQAWLLVDDQNQNQNQKNSDGTIPRRRITPKSVFVAPTFSPENLPPCAEGYSSDSMGRCIKIIKLDEDRHLEFLVSKLNDKFGVIDYEEDVEEFEMTKSEPFQLNIPLNLDEGDYSNDTPQEDLDFAIIVTPTTRDSDKFDKHGTRVDKRNDQADSDMYEKELKKLLEMATTTTTKKGLDLETTTIIAEKDETTTDTITTEKGILETSTIETERDIETTTTVVTTTDVNNEEQTTEANEDFEGESTSDNSDTTTSTDATTTLEVTTDNPTTLPPIKVSSTTPKHPKITTYHPKVITYHPYFDTKVLDSSRTKNLIKFPDNNQATVPRSHPDGTFVRFPDVDSKYQQEGQIHHTRDVNEQYGNYFNEIVTSEPSQHVQEMVLPPKGQISRFFPTHGRNFDSGHQNWFYPPRKTSENSHEYHYEYQIGATAHPPKKSREKQGNLFLIPPKWSDHNQHKPLVLRFSRKHFNVDTNKFKNNEFYRSMPTDDLSFLFGYKHGQTDSHR